MSHVTKVILRVIMFRIRNGIHTEISIEQYGFMKDKETKKAIFVLRMMNERAIRIQKTMYLCFVDSKKAFDRVKFVLIATMLGLSKYCIMNKLLMLKLVMT